MAGEFTRAGAGRRAAVFALLALGLSSCAAAVSRPPVQEVLSPPEWRPGDRWVYQWRSGSQTGEKTVQVLEVKEVNKLPYYVVRIWDVDHYFTSDLHWAATVRDSKVEARMVPPQPWFVWPLEVGRRWVHHGAYEERDGRKPQDDTFAVVGAETIEVPAGRFGALKIAREGSRGDSDQYWFVPEVRWYVKWVGRRGDAEFQEELRQHEAAPRLIPKSPGPPASKTN